MTKPNPFLEKAHAKNNSLQSSGFRPVAKEKIKVQTPPTIKSSLFSRKTKP